MQTIVDEALEAYERTLFWESFDAGYAQLADDSDQWAAVEVETGRREGRHCATSFSDARDTAAGRDLARRLRHARRS